MFYTYLYLREDRTPYYVGKGSTKYRIRECHPRINGRYITVPPPERIIVHEWTTHENAVTAEINLIAFFGRKDRGNGILRNLTDGGEGCPGRVLSEETKRKIASSHRGIRPDEEARKAMRKSALARVQRDGKEHLKRAASLGGLALREIRRKRTTEVQANS